METKFWYSIRNGGDGSAYPVFFECRELSEIDQKYLDEGWGEDCSGDLTIEHDEGTVVKMRNIVTAEEMLKELDSDLKYGLSTKEVLEKRKEIEDVIRKKVIR